MAAATNTEPAKKSTWKGWGIVPKVEVYDSLHDVMSEQLALELTQNACAIADIVPSLPPEKTELPPRLLLEEAPPFLPVENEDTSNDLFLAMMLQHEFDQEHDVLLKKEQDKMNGGSKVVVSYNNHRAIHPAQRSEVDVNEKLFDVPEVKMPKDPSPCFNKQGISGKGKNVVTKHDAQINGIKNALKVMDTFPPEFDTGNSLDMRIPNKVFNNLKVSSKIEAKRSQKHHEKKEHSTQLVAVDEKTKLLLYKLENSGTVENLNGIISTGKESIVFHADAGDFKGCPPNRELALKVYKTTLGKFKNRCMYVKGDMRFIKDDFKKQNPRKIMRIWAEKEEMNLRRMKRFDVPCPEAILTKKHILVMSFIGSKGVAAPKLQDVLFTDKELQSAYKQCVNIMRKMYVDCHLVHADLSEFNLLWHEGTVYVIDVAQSVDSIQSKALEFFMRDCLNVTKFFQSRGLENVASWQELFNDITGMNAAGEGEEFLSQIVKRADDEATMKLDMTKQEFPFEFFFERSCKDKCGEMESDSESDDE